MRSAAMNKRRGPSKRTLQRIECLKTFLSLDRPISKRAAMYRLLSMGESSSTKKFESFNRCMNRALEIPELCDEHFDDDCFVDNRRTADKNVSWVHMESFKEWCQDIYRRDPWQTQQERVEVWIEKNTIVALIERVTKDLDVMLRASSGYFSRTFLHRAAKDLYGITVPLTILYCGDFDPSGLGIEQSAKEGLKKFLLERGWDKHSLDGQITWVRIGVTEADYRAIDEKARVPLKEDDNVKRGDPRAAAFKAQYGDYGVEVEALEVAEIDGLANRLDAAIRERIDWDAWDESKRIEAGEMEGFKGAA